ncbi:MAG TPA: AAA domain-containing protein, partial [Bacteroidia bacterium]|nr:AAA domain-containing protein [Bacteroidia bacterium]
HTSEGKMKDSPELKNIKELKKRIEEFRKMANKYHRKYGKDEKEQRNLLLQEIKNIRHEIKSLQDYFESKLYDEAQVIAGTPIGLWDAKLPHHTYQTLIMDEAGQCIEPLAWCVFPLADKYILAGDHYQLPPTVLSYEAMQQGLNQSILEVAIRSRPPIHLLDTQYRMRPSIAGYSSQYFYESLLKTASHLIDDGVHITFVDTAGAGMNETHGSDGISLQNTGELDIAKQLIELYSLDYKQTAFISPYAGQVVSAKEILPSSMRISTVDSFQGQEMQNLIVSLVRSNEVGEIGFLKDYRRMNVAITRAKEKLFVIGDSATIGHDDFYSGYLDYVEKHGEYKSAWEFLG